MIHPFASDKVATAFDAAAPAARDGLLGLRDLIFQAGDELPEIGRIEEALRWGQSAYLPPDKKAGTTIRLGALKSGGFGLFVHCQTSLIKEYSAMFPGRDRIEGTRAVLFGSVDQIDRLRHGWLIHRALTYHL
jgi:hypothetical protein